ncbi:unnamed protein product [Adineta ricciae]|uniref:UBC core domain-containing protein n=1 Tax=Adineta ricciae TaxID=249248 RepID=A0A815B3S5_ADIRI|nr:unnamed protein product [Adineta ricciae]
MLLFSIVVYFTIIINALLCIPIEQDSMPSIDESIASTSETKQKLTLDEFFDYTTFLHMSFSPNGQYLLYATKRPSPVTEYHAYGLWLYNIQTMETTQITKYLEPNVNPQWSPSSNFITYVSYDKYVSHTANNLPGAFGSRANSPDQFKHGFSVYSIELRIIIFIPVAYSIPTIVTWSQNASTIYVLQNIELNRANLKGELKQSDKESKLYSVRLSGTNGGITYTINILQTIPLHVRELLFVPSEDKFIFISKELTNKNVETNEIYSLDLKDNSIINRLTNDEDDDRMLQLSSDGKTVFFTVNIDQNDDNDAVIQELYALHVKNGTIRRVGKKSELHIIDYTAKVDGGVYVLGQWRTQIQVYSVQSIDGEWVRHDGIPGSYTSVASSSNPNCALAFVYSSSQRPMEIYCAQDVKNLVSARQITNENKLFTERHLPETIVYNWTSKNDASPVLLNRKVIAEIKLLKKLESENKFILDKVSGQSIDTNRPPPRFNNTPITVRSSEHYRHTIEGRLLLQSEPYCRASFLLQIGLTAEYPFKYPDIQFLDPIYHPNISQTGVCCGCDCGFRFADSNYRPTLSLHTILSTIIQMIDSPFVGKNGSHNEECYLEYRNDYPTFYRKALDSTLLYGRPRD